MKLADVCVDYVQVFVIIDKDEMKTNSDVNVKD